ncbi:primosomal protein N' [Propionispora sp. 2/2-37]|uniref:primosomal protein N' n=1 Tax=Propionispora sp. 2/2-37 TaxID=1677858 RepID=UPI001F293260|nr:primosomal protein N' [Propionispora sp. 2/2-37]
MVAHVCINLPVRNISKIFAYVIPGNLQFVNVGWRVIVPFGNRRLEGFIVSVGSEVPDNCELKPLLDVLDNQAWFNEYMLSAAKQISEHYLCSLAEAMRLFIPGKTGINNKKEYSVNTNVEQNSINLSAEEQRALLYLQENGAVSQVKLRKELGSNASKLLAHLIKKNLIVCTTKLKKTRQAKYENILCLAVEPEIAEIYQQGLKHKPAQQRLLNIMIQSKKLTAKKLKTLRIAHSTVHRLVESGMITLIRQQVLRDSYSPVKAKFALEVQLTSEQKQALEPLIASIQTGEYQSYLLHGVTGSGKTQVYLEAVAKVREIGRQAIVLVPEIALTSQIIARFKARFGDDVVVMHSKLSVGERYDAWEKIRTGTAGIVIGARSAVFSPVKRLGIIVIDEEHEFTYKQEETPHYHTKTVAMIRAGLEGAVLLMGSATPSIETYYQALAGKHTLLAMCSRVQQQALPEVRIVDMREEMMQGRRSVISLPLQHLLTETLFRKEQAIILLNRRGYSTFVLCRECGHIIRCTRCSVSMVYHNTNHTLQCHYCQGKMPVPDVCPKCSSRYIRFFGTGTQKMEEELSKLLPNARVARMDQDSTVGKMAHDRILHAFANGEYDILLGTQMVAKGHDIKNVTAVGIISADSALNLPDFRSAERTFALLTQAAGRAGRGSKKGRVIIQTYNPEHYAIMASQNHSYVDFYTEEIKARRILNYPPFTELLKITVFSADEIDARRQAEEIVRLLQPMLRKCPGDEIIGPFSATIAKVNNIFRMNILIKSFALKRIKKHISDLNLNRRANIIIDIDPLHVV